MNNDTAKLLRECNAGLKMGENAINRILPKVKSDKMRQTLQICKNTHAELGDKTHAMLLSGGEDTKPPHRVASAMSDMKIALYMTMNESDSEAASLMTDGCNMGIKSLSKYLNRYKDADRPSKQIAKDLIASEEYLSTSLREYL